MDCLLNSQEVLVTGICDLSDRRQNSSLLAPAVPFFTDFEAMIQTIPVDAILISAPHQYHYLYSLLAMESGKHVFVDKPLASTANEARKLLSLSQQKKKILFPSLPKRYSIVMKTISDLVHSGAIGEVLNLDFVYYRSRYKEFDKSWRNTPEGLGGVIFDAGYQIVDALLGLTENPVHAITCIAGNQGFQVETLAKISVNFENAPTLASIHLGLHLPNGIVLESIVAHGSKGVIVFKRVKQNGNEVVREFYFLDEDKMEKLDSAEEEDMDLKPLLDFIDRVQTGGEAGNLVKRDIRTIEFIERVYKTFEKTQ